MTFKFSESTHLQNLNFTKWNFFSPECRWKVVKFAKNDCIDSMIVLARDEQFLFFPWKWIKGGTIGWFFPIFFLQFFLFFFTFSSPLHLCLGLFNRKTCLFLYTQTHSYITSANLIFSIFLLLLWLLMMLMLFLPSSASVNFNFKLEAEIALFSISPTRLAGRPTRIVLF